MTTVHTICTQFPKMPTLSAIYSLGKKLKHALIGFLSNSDTNITYS